MYFQCAKHIKCPIDGKQKVFFFHALRNSDGTWRPGYRHGCNDKSGDARCVQCWRDVRWRVFQAKK